MSRIFNKSDECLVCQVVNYCKTFYVDSILNKCLISFIKVMWGGEAGHKLVQGITKFVLSIASLNIFETFTIV